MRTTIYGLFFHYMRPTCRPVCVRRTGREPVTVGRYANDHIRLLRHHETY